MANDWTETTRIDTFTTTCTTRRFEATSPADSMRENYDEKKTKVIDGY